MWDMPSPKKEGRRFNSRPREGDGQFNCISLVQGSGVFYASRLHPLVASQVLGKELSGEGQGILDQTFRGAGHHDVTA